ncbi:MAG TPA: xanthine dehydrogenase family protein subunit M [Thermomicrobiales bacterium]|nr:xanthine dehydrogenase family protein subunit M [Thermomicrobiales bacterium]
MFPSSFSYHRAGSVAEAVSLLAANPDAKILAGGHSLIPAMKLRLAAPESLVDIGRIAELRGIAVADEAHIGATATYDAIRSHAQLRDAFPILVEAINVVGDQQVRARGTLGGSLAHADPAADLTAVFLALNGRIRATSPSGEREIAADDLFVDLWTTSLEPNEVVTEVILPLPAAGTRMAYEKHAHPASGYAVVGVAVALAVEDGVVANPRIVITGATSKPTRASAAEAALAGKALDAESIGAAAAQAAVGLEINGDPYASEAYRAHLISVLVRRALERMAS